MHRSKKWIFPVLALLAGASLTPSAPGQDYSERILWKKKPPDDDLFWLTQPEWTAFFVPVKVIERWDVSRLPLYEEDRRALGTALERGRPAEEIAACYPQICEGEACKGSEPRPTSEEEMEDFTRRNRLSDYVLLGRVIATVPGWSSDPTLLVYLGLEARLRMCGPYSFEDDIVPLATSIDSIVVRGRRLCADRAPQWRFEEGDQVLLHGTPRVGPMLMAPARPLLVRDGWIHFPATDFDPYLRMMPLGMYTSAVPAECDGR